MRPRHLVLILVIIMMLILAGCVNTQGNDDFTLIERQITLHNGNTITCVLVDETSPEDTYVDIAGVTCNF